MPYNNQYNPNRGGVGQKGGSFPNVYRGSKPLDVREQGFQDETGQQKAYIIKTQKMPNIISIEDNPEKSKIRMTTATSIADFRSPYNATGENFGEENEHAKFVKADMFDSPGAFGIDRR